MDGTSTAFGHVERAGGINLPDVDDRTGTGNYGWNEQSVSSRCDPQFVRVSGGVEVGLWV